MVPGVVIASNVLTIFAQILGRKKLLRRNQEMKKLTTSDTNSTSSTLSTVTIQSIIDKLKTERHQITTRKNYYGIWKTFNEFFIKLDRKPASWEERLILFVGYLIERKRQLTTI